MSTPGIAALPVIKSRVMKGLKQYEWQIDGNCCGGVNSRSKCIGIMTTGICCMQFIVGLRPWIGRPLPGSCARSTHSTIWSTCRSECRVPGLINVFVMSLIGCFTAPPKANATLYIAFKSTKNKYRLILWQRLGMVFASFSSTFQGISWASVDKATT